MLDFLKAGALTGTIGFAITLVLEDVPLVLRIPLEAELGVPCVGVFLVKKLAIDCWRVAEPVLDGSFLRDGGGLAGVAVGLEDLTIFAVVDGIFDYFDRVNRDPNNLPRSIVVRIYTQVVERMQMAVDEIGEV